MTRSLIYALSKPGQLGNKLAIPQYVTRQLELLSAIYDRVVTVPQGSGEWVKWAKGIHDAGWANLAGGSVTLMTDAAFGPTYSLSEMLGRLDNGDADYWIFSNSGIPFFYYFNSKVVDSKAFQAFWDAKPPADADAARLRQHLFPALATAGFRGGAVVEIAAKAPVVGMVDAHAPRPDLWAEADAPFLLIEDLLQRPDYAPYGLDYLAQGGYPAATASGHLTQLSSVDDKSLMWAKQRDYRNATRHADMKRNTDIQADSNLKSLKVAIHVHAHYPELLDEFLNIFDTYAFSFTLFVTTAESKVTAVNELLTNFKFDSQVVAVPNIGRDLYPLFLLHDRLAAFDIIGHFHTKKSNHERKFVADSWLTELMDTTVVPGDAIVADFASRPELGVVIADIPSFFRVNRIVYPEGEAPLLPLENILWQRMNLPVESPFVPHHKAVMSYGSFFWARYQAISPLLELNVADELPPEPVPENHTILHALERMWVYVAWARGYDYAISQGRYLTVFADAAAPTLEAVPFKRLVRQKITNRVPVGIKRTILNRTGWRAKD